METTKKAFSINTTHGETYCEVYEPVRAAGMEKNVRIEPVLMIHGCGGCVDHWSDSELPVLLTKTGKTVVCYDIYSHGKSVQLSSEVVTHNLALFLGQLNEVIHSPDLPIAGADSFTAHGFSMGCYILLQYCVQFKPFRDSTSPSTKPLINKIVLQSPWDGHVPAFLRGLIHVPLLLRIFKPSDMAGIKSVSALKQILLGLDEKVDYRQSMSTFARAVSGQINYTHSSNKSDTSSKDVSKAETDKESNLGSAEVTSTDDQLTSPNPATQSTLEVADLTVELQKDGIHCPVLVITGTRELPFELTGRRIAKYVHRTYSQQAATSSGTLTDPATSQAESVSPKSTPSTPTCSRKPAYVSEESNVQFKVCKYAGHMSFVKKKNGTYVRSFFQREIVSFVSGVSAAAELNL